MSTAWGTWIGEWIKHQRASGTPPSTIRVRRDYVVRLSVAFRYRDPGAVTTSDLLSWMTSHEWAPNTLRSVRTTLRSFYGWAVVTGRVQASPADGLPVVRVPRGRPRPTPESAYRAALDRADEREWVAIRLAGQCGLRRGEVSRVRGRDIEHDLLGRSLRVIGKGGHVRLVPLPEDLADVIVARGPGWTFPSPEGGHLSANYLGELVSALLPEGMTMHTLRHRAASVAYGATRDLRAVQELLGHSRPETTAVYAAVADDAVRRAMLAAS